MQIDLNKHRLTDEIPMLLSEAYDNHARNDSNPCSICRSNPDQQGRRMHYHGSDFGQCPRQTYFKMTREKESYSKPLSMHPMFLKDGHVHEEAILKSFENDKCFSIQTGSNYAGEIMEIQTKIPFFDPTKKVDVKDEITKFVSKPLRSRVVDVQRHYLLITHFDAVATYKENEDDIGIDFGIECKSVKDDTYNKVSKGEIEDKWYGQMQAYMFATGLDVWYLVVKNRISSRILSPIRIDYDPKYVIQRLTKMNQVYTFANYGREVPIPTGWTKSNPQCKWCDFSDICWK